jgi:hypothetical protein
MKYSLLLMLVVCTANSNAQVIKDTLYLINGSKIVGKIKKIKLGVITFDPDDANDITVQLKKLKTLAAVSKIFRIESIDHKVYFGRIIPGAAAGYATFLSDIDTSTHPVEQISLLYPFRNQFLQRFSGDMQAGFDFTKSSGLARLNYDCQLRYTAKRVEVVFGTSAIYSITDTTFSRDREDISIKNNYYFNTTWFGTVLLKYQRNLELGLLRRFQEGVGGGNKFITSEHIYAWTRGGLVLNQEKNSENTSSGTLTELFGQLEFNFFRFTKPELSFNIAETIYYSLSQKGRIRNDAQLSLSWEIVKNLDITLSCYSNYDNQPPSENSRKFDLGTVMGVAYTFN